MLVGGPANHPRPKSDHGWPSVKREKSEGWMLGDHVRLGAGRGLAREVPIMGTSEGGVLKATHKRMKFGSSEGTSPLTARFSF